MCRLTRRPKIGGHHLDSVASSHEVHSPQCSDERPCAHCLRLFVHAFGHTKCLDAVDWAVPAGLLEEQGHARASRYTGKVTVRFLLDWQPERSVEDIDTDTCMSVEDS